MKVKMKSTCEIKQLFKSVRTILFILLFAHLCQSQTYWTRNFASEDSVCSSNALLAINSQEFLFSVSPPASGKTKLIRVNSGGDVLWQKSMPAVGPDTSKYHAIYALSISDPGAVMMTGAMYSGCDLVFQKIDFDGNLIFGKKITGSSCDYLYGVAALADGGMIGAGETFLTPNSSGFDVLFTKVNAAGEIIWKKNYGDKSEEGAYAIIPTADGNYLAAGFTHDALGAFFDQDVYILKINKDGDTIWTKTFGGKGSEHAFGMTRLSDGNVIIVGETSSDSLGRESGRAAIYVLKIDINGDTLWTRSFFQVAEYIEGKLENRSYVAAATPDGGALIAASHPGILFKINGSGDTLWTKQKKSSLYSTITALGNGIFVMANDFQLQCIVDDRYAFKNTPFGFKIPVSGDSLAYTYLPLNIPEQSTVSLGGTISWVPQTDSVYTEHVMVEVKKAADKSDTLTLNLFVNSKNVNISIGQKVVSGSKGNGQIISVCSMSGLIRFTSAGASQIGIYDIRGRLVETIRIANQTALWSHANHAAGRYFARAIDSRQAKATPFLLMK